MICCPTDLHSIYWLMRHEMCIGQNTFLSWLLWIFFFFLRRASEQVAVFWRVAGDGQHETRHSFYYSECPAGNLIMFDVAVSSTSCSSCERVLTTVTHKFCCLCFFPQKRNTQCQLLNQYLVWIFHTQCKDWTDARQQVGSVQIVNYFWHLLEHCALLCFCNVNEWMGSLLRSCYTLLLG
jgi:hypothetical protein